MSSNKSGFGNGFFLGMIFGAVLVLLFATKKGRKILRALTSEGMEKAKGLRGIRDAIEVDDEVEMDSDYVDPEKIKPIKKPSSHKSSN